MSREELIAMAREADPFGDDGRLVSLAMLPPRKGVGRVANPKPNAISLCSGVGMLDEGVRAGLEFLGIALRTVAYAEWEAPAAAQLIALMEAGCLDEAPVWCGDIRQINAGKFRGVVDLVVAGFPCQDISIASRRAGLDGKRSGLFFDILDLADDCGASGLFLENVSAIATATAAAVDEAEGALEERAAARVVGELADRGWDAEWITLSASDVGASHGRARWFCLAWRRVADAGQHHHVNCPQCRAAGANPTLQRCPEGQELWDTYQQAGMPPHFTWLGRGERKP